MSKTDTASHDSLNLSKTANGVSSILSKKLSIDSEGSCVPDKDILKEVIDGLEGVPGVPTIEEVNRVQKFATDFTTGGFHAFGTVASAYLNKHKKVANVHMEKLAFGKDHLRLNMSREKQVAAPGGKATTHQHYLEGKWVSGSAGTSGAAVKRVREHFSSAAAAAAAE
jgi:hypothetical protein